MVTAVLKGEGDLTQLPSDERPMDLLTPPECIMWVNPIQFTLPPPLALPPNRKLYICYFIRASSRADIGLGHLRAIMRGGSAADILNRTGRVYWRIASAGYQ